MDATSDRGVDVAIGVPLGSPRAVEALTLVRDGGRYVIAGHYQCGCEHDQCA